MTKLYHVPPPPPLLEYIHTGMLRVEQGNSVARDLPRTGSESNATIFVIYILDIDSHCPL